MGGFGHRKIVSASSSLARVRINPMSGTDTSSDPSTRDPSTPDPSTPDPSTPDPSTPDPNSPATSTPATTIELGGQPTEVPGSELVDFDDPVKSLARKVRITKVMAIVECISYACLLVPMTRKYVMHDQSNANYVAIRIIAYFHGIFCVAFAVMVLDIFRVLKWKWWFVLATFAGPPGAVLAHARLRRQPLPTDVPRGLMLF